MADDDGSDWDCVVVGSGAGGGTLAARLVESGFSVCLLEAGSDAAASADGRLPDDYDVPGFHPFASENPAMSWGFGVRHYADQTDRKSTRNSSHQKISYAVFCLKKKNKVKRQFERQKVETRKRGKTQKTRET